MQSIKKYSYNQLQKMLAGKQVHFISDCELFPGFNVTGKVTNITYNGTEIIMKCLTRKGKTITIGSNMKNLQFELI